MYEGFDLLKKRGLDAGRGGNARESRDRAIVGQRDMLTSLTAGRPAGDSARESRGEGFLAGCPQTDTKQDDAG